MPDSVPILTYERPIQEGEIRIEPEAGCVKLRFLSPRQSIRSLIIQLLVGSSIVLVMGYALIDHQLRFRSGEPPLLDLLMFIAVIIAALISWFRALLRRRIITTIIASATGLTIHDERGTRTIAKDMFLRVIVSAPRWRRKWILLAAPHARPPTHSFQLYKQWRQIPESGIVLITHDDAGVLKLAADAINSQFFNHAPPAL